MRPLRIRFVVCIAAPHSRTSRRCIFDCSLASMHRRPVNTEDVIIIWSNIQVSINCWQAKQASRMVCAPEGEAHMSYSLYDAAVTPCIQQLGALAGIIDKAAAHCAANKIEESALLSDRLYPDMFCLARQIRQSADFAMNTGGRLAGVTPPALPATDDPSFAAAKSRVETALAFVKSLTREQVDGAESKVIAWKGGGNDRKMKGNDYLQQFALPNFFFFVTTAYDILRHRGVPLGKRDFLGPVNWL